jgi:hypothetical protein
MKMSRFFQGTIILLVMISISGCFHQRKIIQDTEKPIRGKGTIFITKNLEKNQTEFEWFSAKISTQFETSAESNNFKTNVRIRKDSAIWAQITFSNILIAQSIITPDSVKVILKREKKYFIKDLDYLSNKFGFDMNYQLIQDLLIGNVVGYDKKERYKTTDDSLYYRLATHKDKRMTKLIEKNPKRIDKTVFINYWLYPSNFKQAKLIIEDVADTNRLEVENFNYTIDSLFAHPEVIILKGYSARDSIKLTMNFSKVSWNEKQTFPFNIGENFERID